MALGRALGSATSKAAAPRPIRPYPPPTRRVTGTLRSIPVAAPCGQAPFLQGLLATRRVGAGALTGPDRDDEGEEDGRSGTGDDEQESQVDSDKGDSGSSPASAARNSPPDTVLKRTRGRPPKSLKLGAAAVPLRQRASTGAKARGPPAADRGAAGGVKRMAEAVRRLKARCPGVESHRTLSLLLEERYSSQLLKWVDAGDDVQELQADLVAATRIGKPKIFFIDIGTDGLSEDDNGSLRFDQHIMDVALRSDGRDKRFFVTPLGGKDHLTVELKKRYDIWVERRNYSTDGQTGLWPDQASDMFAWMLTECRRTHPLGCTPVIVGHNIVGFDLPILGPWLASVGFEVPRSWHFIDTMIVAEQLMLEGVAGNQFVGLRPLADMLGIRYKPGVFGSTIDTEINMKVFDQLALMWLSDRQQLDRVRVCAWALISLQEKGTGRWSELQFGSPEQDRGGRGSG